MSVSWSSVGHAFASGFHDLVVGARAIAAFNTKLQPKESEIEIITALVPVYGAEAVLIERLAFAALGEFAALVQASGNATEAAVKMPQVDSDLLLEVEAAMKANPQLVQMAAQAIGIKGA